MFEAIIITSLFTQGLFIVGSEPFILAPFRQWLGNFFGYWKKSGDEYYLEAEGIKGELWKPIWGCPTCMASFWGLITFLIFPYEWYLIPIHLICSSGLNFIIFNNLIKKHLF